jgi:2-keto-4-pentenoate hydratase/2-oxohepta-3-ene-1,7-dioic acid hydratase in catechol pathway
MRLVSFSVPALGGAHCRIGALLADGTVIDLNAAYTLLLERRNGLVDAGARRIAGAIVPTSMRAFLEGGAVSLDAARSVIDAVTDGRVIDVEEISVPEGTAKPLAPVPDAPLIRDFMAFEEHLQNIYPRLGRDIPQTWYELPVYYKGNPASIGSPGDVIDVPSYAETLDFEFEFAAVIGTAGADITPEKALDHVVGYMIYNDFSARDIQQQEMSVGLGPAKGKDFAGAHVFGPWLVTTDEVPDVYDLVMRAEVNGAPWCESSTSTMHWRFEDMIAHASRNERLQVGEIFGSGTVGGGSAAERGTALARGDRVDLTMDRLGTLSNRVGALSPPSPDGGS